MSANKNKNGTWDSQFYYSDWTGKRKKKHKRGFRTKKEAIDWEENFKQKQSKNLDMKFSNFVDIYFADMTSRLRENTIKSKRYIVDLKIMPYFKNRQVGEITAADIRRWQNELIKSEKGYAQTYLKTINNQLSAIFNYAVRYYDLSKNPCKQAGSIGKGNADEMNFWTKDEFERFVCTLNDKPQIYMAFMIMYWTGIRVGELLALTIADFDSNKGTLRINKSYQRIDRRDVITEPKTAKGKRVIALPEFLVSEISNYCSRLYGYMESDRMFAFTKANLEHEMIRGVKLSGVKRIRVHDIRHSHASLLISELNATPLLVAERLGHQRVSTTMGTYVHLFPNQNRQLADQLNQVYLKEGENEDARNT